MEIREIGAFGARTRLSELLERVGRGRVYRITMPIKSRLRELTLPKPLERYNAGKQEKDGASCRPTGTTARPLRVSPSTTVIRSTV